MMMFLCGLSFLFILGCLVEYSFIKSTQPRAALTLTAIILAISGTYMACVGIDNFHLPGLETGGDIKNLFVADSVFCFIFYLGGIFAVMLDYRLRCGKWPDRNM